jgi:predicted DNA-binding transcriptional regulator AlpA
MAQTQILRFEDLKQRKIISNRPTLKRRQEKHGFPLGFKVGNARFWTEDEVEAWLAAMRAQSAAG